MNKQNNQKQSFLATRSKFEHNIAGNIQHQKLPNNQSKHTKRSKMVNLTKIRFELQSVTSRYSKDNQNLAAIQNQYKVIKSVIHSMKTIIFQQEKYRLCNQGGFNQNTFIKYDQQGRYNVLRTSDEVKYSILNILGHFICLSLNDTQKSSFWSPTQKDVIINLIENNDFITVPSKDLFNLTSSIYVRETMLKALHIVQKKAENMILTAVLSIKNLKIYSVQLLSFSGFINGLVAGIQTDLVTFCQVLGWNDYLKIELNSQMIQKIADQMAFLTEFLNRKTNEIINSEQGAKQGKQAQKSSKSRLMTGSQPIKYISSSRNWSKQQKIAVQLGKIYSDSLKIINKPAPNFTKHMTQGRVTTTSISAQNSSFISQRFSRLKNKYLQVSQILQSYRQFESSMNYQQYQSYRNYQHEIKSYQHLQSQINSLKKQIKLGIRKCAGKVWMSFIDYQAKINKVDYNNCFVRTNRHRRNIEFYEAFNMERVQTNYKDLYVKWQQAEYEAYFENFPKRILDVLTLQQIVKLVKLT